MPGMKAGDFDKAEEGITDDFLEALTAIGTPDEVRAGVTRYRDAGATGPLHRPGTTHGFCSNARSSRPVTADCRLPRGLNFSGASVPSPLR